jgi:hypothetical protein
MSAFDINFVTKSSGDPPSARRTGNLLAMIVPAGTAMSVA